MSIEITAENLKKIISEKLEMLRKNSGETNEAAADSLNIDLSEFYRILKGRRLPHLETLLRINQKYKVNMDWWFGGLNNLPRSKNQLKQRAFELQVLTLLKKLDGNFQEFMFNLLKDLVKKTKGAAGKKL